MIPTIANPYICLKDTGTRKGRGVFTLRALSTGDQVEVCPVLILLKEEREWPQIIETRVFDWSALTDRRAPFCHALALGFGSMYNHANPANVIYKADSDNEVLGFYAARDISVDEELTINYNETYGATESKEDVWFARMKIKALP